MLQFAVPEQGQLVQARNRHFLVLHVAEYRGDGQYMHVIELECLDDDALGDELRLVWEREIGAAIFSTSQLPRRDQWDPIGPFDGYVAALRWSTNSVVEGPPLTAPFFGAIEIEHYQLVPVARALTMNRVSLLLADDVGLGKTIEAGLTAQMPIRRHRARTIMIVCPASLQRQWREEMRSKFNLDFRILDRAEVERLRKEYGVHVNPWASFPRIITSVDFIKRQQLLKLFRESLQSKRHRGLRDWDLLVVDEAHNCAPAGGQSYHRDSDRTKLLAEIKDHFEHRLFLTATPQNGYTQSFSGLLELLDPVRFQQKATLDDDDHDQINTVVVRRLKSELNARSTVPRFLTRHVKAGPVAFSENGEGALFDALARYREQGARLAGQIGRRELQLARFLFSILTKRLLPSSYAFARTWWSHVVGYDLGEASYDEVENAARRMPSVKAPRGSRLLGVSCRRPNRRSRTHSQHSELRGSPGGGGMSRNTQSVPQLTSRAVRQTLRADSLDSQTCAAGDEDRRRSDV